jgi:hypothetical protein
MPSITTFGDMAYGDVDTMQDFLQAHDSQHQSFQQRAAVAGNNVPVGDLTQQPDDDWMQRHISYHNALQVFLVPDDTINVNALTDYDWSSADSFYSWMQIHTLLHQKLFQWQTGTPITPPIVTTFLADDANIFVLADDAGTNMLTPG